MKRALLLTTLCSTLISTGVFAGGMDRSGMSISALFEEGSYMELSAEKVDPKISGTLPANNTSSGDIAPSYTQFAGAYKQDLGDDLSMAVIFDQPYGADVEYSKGTGYALAGSNASVETTAITGIMRYKISIPFSVYGGVRYMNSKGEAELPFLSYKMKTDTQNDFGYLVGISYEKAEIGLLTSLTYNSPIDISFTSKETYSTSTSVTSNLDVTMPQTINFNFQTGITKSTLLMFSARWAEWTETKITPTLYTTTLQKGKNLVDHSNNTISYSLGIAQRLTDKLAGSVSIGYEGANNKISGNLSPTDGYTSLSAGFKYDLSEQTAIAAGMSYYWIGDTHTEIGSNQTDFKDNTAVGFGIKVSHTL